MSNGESDRGPALVYTTPYLRKAPRRVAISTSAFSLPGTYQLSRVIGAVIGAVAFSIPGFILIGITGSWYPLVLFASIGGLVGIFAATWKSSTGESAAKSIQLFAAKRTGLVKVGGRYVRAYVGTCRIDRSAFGPVQMIAESEEKMSASDLHGDAVISTLIRPSSRPSVPRVGIESPVDEFSESDVIRTPARNNKQGIFPQFTAALEDIKRQILSSRERKERAASNRHSRELPTMRPIDPRFQQSRLTPPAKAKPAVRADQAKNTGPTPKYTLMPVIHRPRREN